MRSQKRNARSRVVGDWDLKMLEARLLVERMENEVAYRSRGRRFQPLTDAALKQRWLRCLRRQFGVARRRRTELDDRAAELSLRGIQNVPLPPDLQELITANIRKLTHQEIPN
jgi:hypothetical protein